MKNNDNSQDLYTEDLTTQGLHICKIAHLVAKYLNERVNMADPEKSFFSYENEVCVRKTQNNCILSTKRYCLDENNDGSIKVYKGDVAKHRSLGESCHNLKEIANIIHDNIHGRPDTL